MPEGDTIYRAARTLQQALAGQIVTRFETVLPTLARVDDQQPIAGRTIEEVYAAGKHLLIRFSGDLQLRTHMRMNGSWHIYRRGERWQRPRRDMRVVVTTDQWEAVGFNIPVAEFLDPDQLLRQNDLRKLGPDFLAESFDAAEAMRRMRARPDMEIANALLNQRVVSGAGNVYKSEVLFICGVNPFTAVAAVTDDQMERIFRTAQKLLAHNVHDAPPMRRTTGSLEQSQRLWVYGRGGKPCRRCGTRIAYRKQGTDARGTYWCPHCQPI